MNVSFFGTLTGSISGLYYIAKEYPELLPWVIGLLLSLYGVSFVSDKLVQKATGATPKNVEPHSKKKTRNL